MVTDKFIVDLPGMWIAPWPKYFENFWNHCVTIARKNDWKPITVANHELKPLGGKLIQSKTQGWYLRWDNEESHTFFALKWI